MATAPLDREAILRAIEDWPIEEQMTLARAILERASPPPGEPVPPARSTWDALYGVASSGQEPPSDEGIERWRREKYGEV